ncbi:type II toxin-antitoxin system RelE/ParE family toxin, partial [Escherichia coli]|nr:type II toxin-antitoxin system RelE/ParE family toxin [Escherichia coli]
PVEKHMLYFIQTDKDIIIRIFSQQKGASCNLNWQ